jgi:hypothetical protein
MSFHNPVSVPSRVLLGGSIYRVTVIAGVLCLCVVIGLMMPRFGPATANASIRATIVSLVLTAISIWLVWRTNAAASMLSPALLYVFYSVVFINAGTMFAEFGIVHRNALGRTYLNSSSLPASLALLSFALGVHAVSSYRRFRPFREIADFWMKPILDNWAGEIHRIAWIVVSIAGVITTVLLFGEGREAEAATYIDFVGSPNIIGLSILLPLAVILGLIRPSVRSWTVLLSLVIVVGDVMTGGRYLLFDFTVTILIMIQVLHKAHLVLRMRVILPGLIFLIAFFIAQAVRRDPSFSSSANGHEFLQRAWEVSFQRVVLIQAHAFRYIESSFPEVYDFFGGFTYIDQLKGLLPLVNASFRLPQWLSSEMGIVVDGRPAYLPPTFAGEAFANFGLEGMVILSFGWGMLLQLLFIWFLRSSKKLDVVVAFVFLAGYMGRSAILGVSVPVRIAFQVLVFFLIVRLVGRQK